MRALDEMGYVIPTPVQSASIPAILGGSDVCSSAITGSGKSAAFLIPIIHELIASRGLPGPKAIVVSPTRELAVQLHRVAETIGANCHVTSVPVIGGLSSEEQTEKLTPAPDIVIGTPGRIIDVVFNSKAINFKNVRFYVLDEADRLLSQGFDKEIQTITNALPAERQTLLFTATMSDAVAKIAARIQKEPVRIKVDPFGEMSKNLRQEFLKVKEQNRIPALIALCQNRCTEKTIVFFPTKLLAHQTAILFQNIGIAAGELHADLPQPERTASLEKFTTGEIRVLLASDLAARGIDVQDVMFVVNFTIPPDIERYIHRVGRTARGESSGTAISLFATTEEKRVFKKVAKNAKGPVVRLSLDEELLTQAKGVYTQYREHIETKLKVEEEERAQRAEREAERRMKIMLDVEEEIPPEAPNKPKQNKKKSRK